MDFVINQVRTREYQDVPFPKKYALAEVRWDRINSLRASCAAQSFLCGKFSTARLEVSPNLRHAGVFQTSTMANLGIGFQGPLTRVSMGWWLLRLSAKILALLRLSVNFFQLRLIVNLKIIFVKKQKQTRERPEICRGPTFIVKEMAVSTLEKY